MNRALVLGLLVALVSAGCGGAAARKGHTVTFSGGGAFPPSTIIGSSSVGGCMRDAKTLVHDSRDYYLHSTSEPGPADLYYDEMRLDYAHFQADDCTSNELRDAMKRGLTPPQRTFLLHNVASDLHRAFQEALR
ncbi:MAG TPA: hypothetical protein VJ838_11450 [Gaiellaceae bacterium]|nr:hypothetical protein [Gaiellaceae bacterium]